MKKTCKNCHNVEVHYLNRGRVRSICKNCWREYNKKYYRSYIDKHPELRLKVMHAYRFGGNREKVIVRDGEKCVRCRLTRQEHRHLYGGDLTVDHIDGNRNNNVLNNLLTLCRKCHGIKDGGRHGARYLAGVVV